MRIAAAILLILVILFSTAELSRWRRADFVSVLTGDQKIRRVIGITLLLIISSMLFVGSYWPIPVMLPPLFKSVEIIYWLFVSLLTAFLPLIAFFEWKDSLKRSAELRRETYRMVVTSSLPAEPVPGDSQGVDHTDE